MGDQEERNEITDDQEERDDRKIVPRRRARYNPRNLHG
jgi:hypothetical protein